jgi:hypothetical protein
MRDFQEFLKEKDPEFAEAAGQYTNWHAADRAKASDKRAHAEKKPCGCARGKFCAKCKVEK